MKKPCSVCGEKHFLTQHHITPRRLRMNDERTIDVCRKCHDLIEQEIKRQEILILRKHLPMYWRVVKVFTERRR